MKRTTTRANEGDAVRGGKFMKGRAALPLDPEGCTRSLAGGRPSADLPLPASAGNPGIRIRTFIRAHRTLNPAQ